MATTGDDSDVIEMTVRSYANLIVQPAAYIDCSDMTDEEYAEFVRNIEEDARELALENHDPGDEDRSER